MRITTTRVSLPTDNVVLQKHQTTKRNPRGYTDTELRRWRRQGGDHIYNGANSVLSSANYDTGRVWKEGRR